MEKVLDLKMHGVMELGREELTEINGGGWLGDAWDWIKGAAGDTWDWIIDHITLSIN